MVEHYGDADFQERSQVRVLSVKFYYYFSKQKPNKMIKIKEETFGQMYDKIYERIIQSEGSFSGFGVEPEESVKEYLENLWKVGKKWESIILLITYHYTRKDSLLLELSGKTISFSKFSFLPDILRSLSLRYDDRFGDIVIGREEYSELEKNIDSILPDLTSRSKMTNFYGDATIRNSEKTYFDKLIKTGDRKKFIKLLVLFKKTKLGNIKLGGDTYKKGVELPELLEVVK